jgi:hypothetical protein
VEVIGQFLSGLLVLIRHAEFKFSFLRPQDDRLAVHATHHVEGGLGLAAQRQFQKVVLDASGKGFAQLGLNFKKTIRRAKSANALMRSLMVVVFNPELDAFAGHLKALELDPDQKLLPDARPEAFHFAQGHGVMGPGLDVTDPILFQLRFKPTGAPPRGVLTTIIGEHLLWGLIFAHGDPIDFNDGLRRGAAKQIRPHDIPRIVIQIGNEVGVAAPEAKREDVRLPHLVGGSPFKKPWPRQVPWARRFGEGHELGLLQTLTHRRGTAGQQKTTA